jgi:hypothetical protein
MTDTNEWLHRQPVQLIGVQEFERLPGPSRANLARYNALLDLQSLTIWLPRWDLF